jgi:scyllo-inositol 2-dehydrogenase (NADP+)
MIKLGIIGTSIIAEKFIKSAMLVEDLKLMAIYSRSEEKAAAFGEKYGIANIFTDLSAMAKSDTIDAVYIASPNSFHAEQSILFLKNKKHVLCEKPIASNVKELNSMIAAARDNSVLLMEAMITTTLPNFKAIEENLYKLGKIRRYFGSYCQYSSRYDAHRAGENVNTFKAEFSNGSIMDLGVYCIHPLVKLFGMPEEITASSLRLPSGVDGQGSLILTYKEMEGVIIHSKIAESFVSSEIQGEKGTMIIDKICKPQKVQIIYRDGTIEDLTMPQRAELMYYEASEFIQLIKSNKSESELNSYDKSLKVLDIIERARIKTGIIYPSDN